jgi:hypothetical protein
MGSPKGRKGIGTRVSEIPTNSAGWAYVAATFENVVITEMDTDLDGLPDSWEIANFGDLSQGPSGDFDGDGLTNLQEYQSGTDPEKPDSYLTVSAALGLPNGYITPSGQVPVLWGGGITFTITPEAGYHIDGVIVDGSPVGTPSTYPFQNVIANHTISATFASNPTYTITASAESGGTISPSGSVTVQYDQSQTFTINTDPLQNAIVTDVVVDNVALGPPASLPYTYTFDHVV